MLTNLSIRDIVLVDHLDIEFSRGLSVLTGETGAGKSILLDSLGLAIGTRADARLIRHSCDRASVSAVFDIPAEHEVMRLVAEHDLKIEKSDNLILRRTLHVDGGSRAFINDQPVSVSFLKTVGEVLVEVHGQFDSQRLLKIDTHRLLLDVFADHEKYIHECLNSVLMQKVNFINEILVGVEEGDYNTIKICKEFEKKHPNRLKVVVNPRDNVIYISERRIGRANFLMYSKKLEENI